MIDRRWHNDTAYLQDKLCVSWIDHQQMSFIFKISILDFTISLNDNNPFFIWALKYSGIKARFQILEEFAGYILLEYNI